MIWKINIENGDDEDEYEDEDADYDKEDRDWFQVLLAGRVVVGAAIGVASAVVPVYISEVLKFTICFHFGGIKVHHLFTFRR